MFGDPDTCEQPTSAVMRVVVALAVCVALPAVLLLALIEVLVGEQLRADERARRFEGR